MSEPAKAKRMLRGLSDLQGITFAAKLRVEPASDPRYGDSNPLDRVVLPTDPEWRRIMGGEPVPAQPSTRPARAAATVADTAPVWAPPDTGSTTGTNPPAQAPLWAPHGHQAAPPPTPPAVGGPPWLNG
jgi:hypothetical protein